MEKLKTDALNIITDRSLDYRQKKHSLAAIAENSQDYPSLDKKTQQAINEKIICDLFEGHAPYRPRYILPDYQKALREGIKYLELDPPSDMDEAINFLTILYQYVPSITGYSVYLGNIDSLLLDYADNLTQEEIYKKIRLFWRYIDRSMPDGFVHANIGPEDNIIARTILKVERESKQVVPNLTLKYDRQITGDSLIKEAVETVFDVAKPHIANHRMNAESFNGDYGIASCYNTLKTGGGSHTLIRLNLKKTADKHTGDLESFFTDTLPQYCSMTLDVTEARIRYLVEKVNYFDSDFLATEKLISLDNFSAMFGVFGLAECVNTLLKREGSDKRYGGDAEANRLGHNILIRIKEIIDNRELPYCQGNGGHAFFHAQSGIDSDPEETAGARIPIGEEPDIYSHIMTVAPHHNLFDGGVSDIFHFDETAKRNPQAIVDIINGAFKKGMRMFTFNLSGGEFIRITGYLVRRSDLKRFREEGSRYNSTLFGANTMDNTNVEKRRSQRVDNPEKRGENF